MSGQNSAISAEQIRAAEDWIQSDPNEACRQEATAILSAAKSENASLEDIKTFKKHFAARIEFGTAGLRGEMAAGPACMNDLIVIQASQGLASYILEVFGSAGCDKGVVIGFDHRCRGTLSSRRFAQITAIAMHLKGIRVYMADKIVCTPWVPFMVNKVGAAAGVMVTASHNPKQDNGYKVYWANGSQIVAPHDKGIAQQILANLKPWDVSAYTNGTPESAHALRSGTVETVASNQDYIDALTANLCNRKSKNASSTLRITYTAMHGVGAPYVQAVFKAFSLPDPILVREQIETDPEFPTVKFPNPEEGKGALSMAMKTAESNQSRVIFANDPDADRLAVAERLSSNAAEADKNRFGNTNEWRIFTGNEIGAMLAHWQWTQYKRRVHNDDSQAVAQAAKDVYMLASTVSSKMIGAIAKAEGFNFEETLTGFKWMGNRTAELQEQGKTVLFSFEEAIGFCVGNVVRDKDGVGAAAVMGELASSLYEEGKSLSEYMTFLYTKYGHFMTKNKYLFVDDAAKTNAVFKRLRNEGHYWHKVGRWPIKYIRDLGVPGVDTSTHDLKPRLPVSNSSYMITFTLANGCVATLRTSGTEPKLKYYCELSGPDPDTTRLELDQIVESIIEEMLQPDVFGLERPKAE